MGVGSLVLPASSLTMIAGAWLGPVTTDQRAGLLTVAAAASTFAALQPRPQRETAVAQVAATPPLRGEPIDDLEAVIAAW